MQICSTTNTHYQTNRCRIAYPPTQTRGTSQAHIHSPAPPAPGLWGHGQSRKGAIHCKLNKQQLPLGLPQRNSSQDTSIIKRFDRALSERKTNSPKIVQTLLHYLKRARTRARTPLQECFNFHIRTERSVDAKACAFLHVFCYLHPPRMEREDVCQSADSSVIKDCFPSAQALCNVPHGCKSYEVKGFGGKDEGGVRRGRGGCSVH